MRGNPCLPFLGVALLVGAAPLGFHVTPASARPAAQQAGKSVKKKKTHKKRQRGQTTPTPDRIREIQSALAREGVYQGEPTGKWDAKSIEAMKKFQTAQGLNPTGKLDALSLQKLGFGSEVAGRAAPRPPAAPATPPK